MPFPFNFRRESVRCWCEQIMASRTITTLESSKDETKRNILRLQQQAETQFNAAAKDIKEKVEDLKEDEIDDFVNNNFDQLNATFLGHSNNLRQDVLKKKPKKPKREDFSSEAGYAAALENYEIESKFFKEFVVWTTSVVGKLMEWISDLFTTIKNFFKDLWNWIKNAFANIAEKVYKFVKFVGEKISGLFNFLFG